MPGGLLNLVSYGNLNVIVNGNPSKTFFKTTYAKYTNFGLQKFRIDFDGLRTLRLTEDSHFRFKVPRYADLFMDTYFVITLPTIWSPILDASSNKPKPYRFQWIENLGSQLIRKVRFIIGSQIIYEFTGQYLYNMVQRDFSEGKKKLFDEMTGNIAELNDPANFMNRGGIYPNAYLPPGTEWTQEQQNAGPQPSIPSRNLYIPFNIWSTLSSKLAIPLVSLQYNELHIEVTCRPIQELFTVQNLDDIDNSQNRIQADQNDERYKFYRFLQPPPKSKLDGTKDDDYPIRKTDWYANIHLLSTYAFLSEDEVKVFASKPQKYLIKDVREENFYNTTGNLKTRINSTGLVSSWMWYFQRSDVKLRNQWSNYTNWDYSNKLQFYVSGGDINNNNSYNAPYNPTNQRDIMLTWGLQIDGKVRENTFDAGVLNYVEKYVRTAGNAKSGLYCYNFCLTTDPFQYQPSGAINLSKFNNIEFEYSTHLPPLDPSAQTYTICDASGDIIGINKPVWRIYDYNYNLYVMEERYNILSFESGQAGLLFAR